jgi:2-desacetyl-2-hydroxyethyl bacteriochlorophyllide A dehydrogenase
MRAAAWVAPEELALVEREEPVATEGQAVVAVAACGVCGSDLHSFRHGLAVKPGNVLGHEFCGEIVAAPGVEGIAVGDRVTVRPLIPCGVCERCRAGALQLCEGRHERDVGYASPGAFAERVLVPHAVVGRTIFPLPPEVSDAGGALVEPLAVALHAVTLGAAQPDDVVLISGAGTIGLAVTALLRLTGVETIVVAELSPRRRRRALTLGATLAVDPTIEDVTKLIRAITGPGAYGLGARADVAFECAGAPSALATALKSVRQGGTIVLSGIYGREVGVRLDRIVEKELRVQGAVAYRDEFAAVIEHLAAGRLRAEDFVSHTFELEQIATAFATQMDAMESLKVQVRPRAGHGGEAAQTPASRAAVSAS